MYLIRKTGSEGSLFFVCDLKFKNSCNIYKNIFNLSRLSTFFS